MLDSAPEARSRLVKPALVTPDPPNATGSYGPLAVRWAKRKLGLVLGPWQRYALKRLLLHDSAGDLIAKLGLVSVARQNGKSVIVRTLVGWMLDEGIYTPALSEWRFILLAAHDAKQARIPYSMIRTDLESYALATIASTARRRRYGQQITRSSYWTGLEHHGVSVDVATAAPGSARGVSAGLICFDEVLTQTSFAMYEVLSPAQSAVRNSFMLMTSTAGFADSMVLRAMHDRAIRQASGGEKHDPSFTAMWWRAPHDDVTPGDYEELREANPALEDGRLSFNSLKSEHAILPKGSWIRERLNRWSDERVDAPFSLEQWGRCRIPDPLHPVNLPNDANYIVTVDVHADWTEGVIMVSALRTDGRVGTEVHRYLKPSMTKQLSANDFIIEIRNLCERYNVSKILYRHNSAMGPALERFATEGHNVKHVPRTVLAQACNDFAEAVISKRMVHDNAYLDTQVAMGKRRQIGQGESWVWTLGDEPACGLIAMSMGVHESAKQAQEPQIF